MKKKQRDGPVILKFPGVAKDETLELVRNARNISAVWVQRSGVWVRLRVKRDTPKRA